jgi:hypothetical protein
VQLLAALRPDCVEYEPAGHDWHVDTLDAAVYGE